MGSFSSAPVLLEPKLMSPARCYETYRWGVSWQDRFVRAYIESALALQYGKGLLASSSQEPALDDAVEQLKAAARAYLPISHLLWGLWGLIQVQSYVSSLTDLTSTAMRLGQCVSVMYGSGHCLLHTSYSRALLSSEHADMDISICPAQLI